MTISWLSPLPSSPGLRLILLCCLLIPKNLLCTAAVPGTENQAGVGDRDGIFRLSADKQTSATLLHVLKESPQVASFKTNYAGRDSDCGDDELCRWEIRVAEPDKSSEFAASLGREGIVAELIENDDPPVMDDIASNEPSDEASSDQNDAGAYSVLAQAWSKLVDDIQEGVDQIKTKKFSTWSCFFTTTLLLASAPWLIAVGIVMFAKHRAARGGSLLPGQSLSGGGLYGSVLTDVEVYDDIDSRRPSWTTPPMQRAGSGATQHGRLDSAASRPCQQGPSLHRGAKASNLLSRTDVEYYDVEGMLDDVPYYEPRIPGRRH